MRSYLKAIDDEKAMNTQLLADLQKNANSRLELLLNKLKEEQESTKSLFEKECRNAFREFLFTEFDK